MFSKKISQMVAEEAKKAQAPKKPATGQPKKTLNKKPLPGSKNRSMEMDDFPAGKPSKRKLPIQKSPFRR